MSQQCSTDGVRRASAHHTRVDLHVLSEFIYLLSQCRTLASEQLVEADGTATHYRHLQRS